jgi:hypothetical protein
VKDVLEDLFSGRKPRECNSAAFARGLILGAIVEDMPWERYVGSACAWLSPFSMLTAVAVVFGSRCPAARG